MVEPSEAFKARDAESYDGVVDSFDRYTVRFTRPIARRMVELAQVGAGDRVLDVGAGTGVVALEVAERLGLGGQVTAIDLSEKMLAVAEEKARQGGLGSRLVTRREDAEATSFGSETFDRVLSLYALFHFPRPATAVREMFRVLRPGGGVVVAVGSSPPFRSREGLLYLAKRLRFVVQTKRRKWLAAPAFLDELVDRHLPRSSGDEESELARHRDHGRSVVSLPRLFEEAGFVDLETQAEAGLGVLETPDEFWDLARTFSSKSRKRLEAAGPGEVGRVKEAFMTGARAVVEAGGKLTYPFAAYIVRGRRP